jgi:hypothetical protein
MNPPRLTGWRKTREKKRAIYRLHFPMVSLVLDRGETGLAEMQAALGVSLQATRTILSLAQEAGLCQTRRIGLRTYVSKPGTQLPDPGVWLRVQRGAKAKEYLLRKETMKTEYSQTPKARYMRERALDPLLAARDEESKIRSRNKKKQKQAIWNQSMFRRTDARFLEAVSHHLSRGRDAARIAVWLNEPMSRVEAAIAEIRKGESV